MHVQGFSRQNVFRKFCPRLQVFQFFCFQIFTDISFTGHGLSQKKAREEEKESKEHAGKVM